MKVWLDGKAIEFEESEVNHLGGNIWVDGHILFLAVGNRGQIWHAPWRRETGSMGHLNVGPQHTADQLLPQMILYWLSTGLL